MQGIEGVHTRRNRKVKGVHTWNKRSTYNKKKEYIQGIK